MPQFLTAKRDHSEMHATQPIGYAQDSSPPCHQELVLTDFPSLAPTSPMALPGFTSQEAVVLSSQFRTSYPTPSLPWKASGAPVSALFQRENQAGLRTWGRLGGFPPGSLWSGCLDWGPEGVARWGLWGLHPLGTALPSSKSAGLGPVRPGSCDARCSASGGSGQSLVETTQAPGVAGGPAAVGGEGALLAGRGWWCWAGQHPVPLEPVNPDTVNFDPVALGSVLSDTVALRLVLVGLVPVDAVCWKPGPLAVEAVAGPAGEPAGRHMAAGLAAGCSRPVNCGGAPPEQRA
nr:uncharacterized protein LOC110143439 [Odocoileus virginianus texanus]